MFAGPLDPALPIQKNLFDFFPHHFTFTTSRILQDKFHRLDGKALALRRNLAGHGFDGFDIAQDEEDVITIFGEILDFEPLKAHWSEDFVIRNCAKTPGDLVEDVQLWEERCVHKSVYPKTLKQAVFGEPSYYILYEFLGSSDYRFKRQHDKKSVMMQG